jgi:hypothetical protein
MSGVFRTIDPHPLTARWVERGGGGSIVRKTPDTAVHSIYVSTLSAVHRSLHKLWRFNPILDLCLLGTI